MKHLYIPSSTDSVKNLIEQNLGGRMRTLASLLQISNEL